MPDFSFKMNGQLFGLWLIFSSFVNMKLNEVPNSHRALQKAHNVHKGQNIFSFSTAIYDKQRKQLQGIVSQKLSTGKLGGKQH